MPKIRPKYGICEDPRATPEAIDALVDYLRHLKASAKTAQASAKAATVISDEPQFAAAESYWRNVASGLQWAIGRLLKSREYARERQAKQN